MAEVFTRGGKAFLIDPDSGHVAVIDSDKVGAALAGGFLPATKEEALGGSKEEYYSTAGQQLKTGALSALSGATLGGSDVLATGAGLVTPEELKAGREVNPNLALGANIAGSVAGSFIPGGPLALASKGASKAGSALGLAAAKGLKTSAGAFIPKAAEMIGREALMGGAIGAGQGLSEVAENDMTMGEAMLRIAETGGHGALFGAGLGVAGLGIRAVPEKYFTYISNGSDKLKKLTAEEKIVRAELDFARSAAKPADYISGIEDRLMNISSMVKDQQVDVLKRVFHRAIGMGVGASLGGGMGAGALGFLMAPSVVKVLGKALAPAAEKAGDVAKRIYKRIEPIAEKTMEVARTSEKVARGVGAVVGGVKTASEALADKSPMAARIVSGISSAEQKASELIGKGASAVGKIFEGEPSQNIKGALASAVGYSLEHSPMVVNAATGFASGGIGGAIYSAAKGDLTHQIEHKILEVIQNKITRPIKTGLETSVMGADLLDFTDQVDDLDPDTMDAVIQAQMPHGIPPQMAKQVSQRVSAALDVLRANKPAANGQKPNMAEIKKFNAVAKSVTDPDSFVHDFAAGRLNGAQVSAWERVYPEALDQLRAVVKAEMAHNEATGGKYSRQQKASIDTLLGEHKLYDSNRVAQLQAMHQMAQGEKASQRSRQVGLAQNRQTQMQRISGGS